MRLSIKDKVSNENVEKVVRPPNNPAVRKDFRFGVEFKLGRVRKIPIIKDPIIFTVKVA